MINLKNLLLLLLMMTVAMANAQKYNLGKVTVEELQQKQHPTDTSAAAAIIFKKGEVTFRYDAVDGFVKRTAVLAKIKIYKNQQEAD